MRLCESSGKRNRQAIFRKQEEESSADGVCIDDPSPTADQKVAVLGEAFKVLYRVSYPQTTNRVQVSSATQAEGHVVELCLDEEAPSEHPSEAHEGTHTMSQASVKDQEQIHEHEVVAQLQPDLGIVEQSPKSSMLTNDHLLSPRGWHLLNLLYGRQQHHHELSIPHLKNASTRASDRQQPVSASPSVSTPHLQHASVRIIDRQQSALGVAN